MNYSKAIRIARALADVPQRELAKRISVDSSLVSMLESGKRKPSLKTLEKISTALGIPFHLFTLLASEAHDVRDADAQTVHRLAVGLSKLLLGGGEHGTRRGTAGNRKAANLERKPTSGHTQNSKRNAS
jgi:transcriptional regulator with XRE-family HTH domain